MKKQLLFCLVLLAAFNLSAQTNLISNSSFEDWDSFDTNPDDWTRFLDGFWERKTDAQDGSASLQLEIATGRTFNYINTSYDDQEIALTSGTTYVCTFYYKAVSGTLTEVEYILRDNSGVFATAITSGEASFTDFSTTEWRKGEFEYTADVDYSSIQVFVYSRGEAGAQVLIDNISLTDKSTLSTSEFSIDSKEFNMYPNPISSNEILSFDKSVDVTLFDITGREITSKTNTKSLEIPSLISGTYIVKTNLGLTKTLFIK